jgi:hypothetical protein
VQDEYINKIRREFNALADSLPDPPKRIRKKKVPVEKPPVEKAKPKPITKPKELVKMPKNKVKKPKMGDKLNKRSDYRYTDSIVRMYGKRSARRIINLAQKSKKSYLGTGGDMEGKTYTDEYKQLKEKITADGRKFCWWVKEYLPGWSYNRVMKQLYGATQRINPEILSAVNAYLEK